jgi:hypothetical protein
MKPGMKPLALEEIYQYAPCYSVVGPYDVEVEVPETLYNRLVSTRAAYLAVCGEVDQYKRDQEANNHG